MELRNLELLDYRLRLQKKLLTILLDKFCFENKFKNLKILQWKIGNDNKNREFIKFKLRRAKIIKNMFSIFFPSIKKLRKHKL